MRIAIDARMMGPLNTRGIGRYVEELIRGLVGLKTEDRFVLLVRNPGASPFHGLDRVEHIAADIPWYGLAEQYRMPGLLRSAKADIVHVPHWNVPFAFRQPFVVTVHDLLLRHEPKSVKATTRNQATACLKRLGYRATLRDVMRRASLILAPTRYTADDVRDLYSVSERRLVVTGEGVSDLSAPDPGRVPDGRFLFYVGSAYPHKRLDLLLDAWKNISRRYTDLQLVIAGEEDVFMARLVARAKQEGLPRVMFTGRVTDAELAAFYERAEGLVFPSSFEGFGLPPLEALAAGCPVVSSDATCLPEILPQGGVFFFRNGDLDGMIRAIDMLQEAGNTAKMQAREAGSHVRQMYRWQDVASRTLTAYERAVHHVIHH